MVRIIMSQVKAHYGFMEFIICEQQAMMHVITINCNNGITEVQARNLQKIFCFLVARHLFAH
jgi:hypothetical protein